jgi:hypothetical protein
MIVSFVVFEYTRLSALALQKIRRIKNVEMLDHKCSLALPECHSVYGDVEMSGNQPVIRTI